MASSLAALLLVASALAQESDQLDLASGKALFEKSWVTAPASTQASDGLGPYFNARSCAACHRDGGAGSYPTTLTQVIDDPVLGKQLQRYAVLGLAAETADLQHQGSLRLPPSLVGVYQFELVSDAALTALADPQDRDGDGISGRIVKRYGRKADIATLSEQIGKAFSLDMGLGNRYFPSPWGDCTAAQRACRELPAGATQNETEVSDSVLALIEQWLSSLNVPVTQITTELLFEQFGCADCHVAQLATSKGNINAWTDLLLHDLGPTLAADLPVAADPTAALPSEWRTAPLWHLETQTRFLHDGRAGSLTQAIELHGGEAQASKQLFVAATKLQQERLLAFLQSL